MILWGIAQLARLPIWYLLRFFAGFCAIANGAYIGVGSFGGVGDAGDLVRHGAAAWHLWLFGAICVPAGVLLWHGLGGHFGFGEANGRVNLPTAYGCLTISSPAAHYFLNRQDKVGHKIFTIDYTKTIEIDGGATVTFHGDGQNGRLISNFLKLVVPDVAPAPKAFNGQFLQVNVVDVTEAK